MSSTTVVGPEGRTVRVELHDEVLPWPVGDDDVWTITDEHRAFARELSLADLADHLERIASGDMQALRGADLDDLADPASVDDVVASLSGPAHEMDLALLASVDPGELETAVGRIAYLQSLDRLAARVAAMRADVLVAMAGAEASGDYQLETSLEHEVAVARRSSRYSAGRAIENARALASTFPAFAAALRSGEISEAHCSLLVDKTRAVADTDVLAAIERRVLPKARRLPVGRFGKEVAAAVAALDSDAVARTRRARDQRTVYARQLDDGLGFLGVVHDWGVIAALQATVDADAEALRRERGGAAAVAAEDDDARMDACRADALAARMLGQVADDGSVTWEPRDSVQVTLELVLDLDTLRGEADRVAMLAGQPVPAEIARERAEGVRTWRRVVTDPADGHLLDYGTRQYLPDALRRYVLARDGGCLAPDCTTRAPRRLQMDHVVAFPEGSSSAANCDTKCVTCHQLKTAGRVRVTDSAADGSRTWTTGWGQRVRIEPRPFLHDPRDEHPSPPPRSAGPSELALAAPPLAGSARPPQPRSTSDPTTPPF